MQRSLSRPPGMEAVELMVMHSEYHKLPVLRAGCCIAPNAAKAAVKADHGKISKRWRRYAETDSQYAKCKS
jgi:uracil phosphoribosyltransferase